MTSYTRYGEAIAHLIKERNLSQKYIADYIDMNTAAFHRLLNVTKRPHKETREKLNNILDVEIKQIPDGRWVLKDKPRPIFEAETNHLIYAVNEVLKNASTNNGDNTILLSTLKNQVETFIHQQEAIIGNCKSILSTIEQLLMQQNG